MGRKRPVFTEEDPVSVELANVAAGNVVRQTGVWPVSRQDLIQEIRYEGRPAADKIKSLEELREIIQSEQQAGKKVVFTNGCFDLLHRGHHHLLNGARREGDVLVVAVNSDTSIRRLKGPDRPNISQEERVSNLADLEAVNYVIVFDDDGPDRLLESLRPQVLVLASLDEDLRTKALSRPVSGNPLLHLTYGKCSRRIEGTSIIRHRPSL